MHPQIASILFGLVILGLFVLDRDREARTSKALWIPLLWFLIGASRNVSEWLEPPNPSSDRYLDGNPLDRTILTALLMFGVIVLVGRRRRAGALLTRANATILLYFVYCGLSILWSDYPEVAFRRWIRSLGDLIMVLVVLTEPDRLAAFKRLLTRAGFLLVPLSILFIKYYPDLGRSYQRSTGNPFWRGVASDKNGLGLICLIFGLATTWHFLQAWRGERESRRRGPLIANGACFAMAVWLILQADSATALGCWILVSCIMVLTARLEVARRRAFVHLLVAAALFLPLSVLFLNTGAGLTEYMGRDSTITGRTEIWRLVLGMAADPLLGTGFESFWLGERLERMWRLYYFHPNQAHNGYIEIFLNLGWLGVALIALIMITGYRHIVKAIRRPGEAGSVRLAFFVTAALYNLTEAGFKTMHPVWIVFLLSLAVVPEAPTLKVRPQRTDDSLRHPWDPPVEQSAIFGAGRIAMRVESWTNRVVTVLGPPHSARLA